jgi:hypothetical protein
VARAAEPDASVRRLASLFRSHPAWTAAAALLSDAASSNVRFRQRPGEAWHLARVRGKTRLAPGARRDADLELTFTPAAIERLTATRGGIGAFAVALFDLAVERDATRGVEIRVLAPFSRLVRRGYLRLLVAGGPRVLVWGAAHGVRSLPQLRRFVARARAGSGLSPDAEMAQDSKPPRGRRTSRRSPAWRSARRRKPPPA